MGLGKKLRKKIGRVALAGATFGLSEAAKGAKKMFSAPKIKDGSVDPALEARSAAAKKIVRKPVKTQAGSGQIEYMAEYEE